ncbi:trichohyalin isoform X2 [Anabas testudineus]|uniref:trichohyalin isoform X2 n=1 Tax=Anabas testudineus TaxID=64144 RepID=UPI000E4564BD|nr:trichohyalin isoform X2 [Anabas testudineus]
MVLWGSKGLTAPSLTLSNINMSDSKLQPGGKISRDPSPRPAMTTQLAQERSNNQEEYRRRQRHMEKIREKGRYNEMDSWERYYERDRATAPKWKEGEREWIERERRQEDDRSRNVRALLNVEKHISLEKGIKKGDTFPRIAKGYADHGRRKMSATVTTDEDRGERRKRDWQRQTEIDDWEREREREWQRDRYREKERDDIYSRTRQEAKKIGRRPVEDEKLRERERYQEPDAQVQDRRRDVGDLRERRERYAARIRENPRPNTGEKQGWTTSDRQRDREIDTDRWEREKAQKSGGRRDARSEGDSDERELRRERVRDREKEHSKSEGDDEGKKVRGGDRDRHRYREDNGQRYRDRDRDREREADIFRKRGVEKDGERYRDVDKREAEGEKWREKRGDLKDDRAWSNDRRVDDRSRENKQKKYRDRKEREADPSWNDTTGRSSQSLNKTAPRLLPRQAVSSGEWSSDMDSEMRYRPGRNSYEESGRKSTSENDVEEQRDPERVTDGNQMKQKRSERQDSDTGELTGSMPAQRRMWLEPQRNKNSKEEFVDRERHKREKERRRKEKSVESHAKWIGEGWQVKQDPDELLNQHSYRGIHGGRNEYRADIERETEGVSVDEEELHEVLRETNNGRKEHLSDGNEGIEGSWRKEVEGENVADNIKDSDTEEGGSTEKGSETGWKRKSDRTLSGEDFVTVSSWGDDEEEREDEDFQDCEESWECGVTYDSTSPVGFKEGNRDRQREEEWTMGQEEKVDDEEERTEKQPQYLFYVIGQTLPRSQPGCLSPSQVDQMGHVGRDNPELEKHNCWGDDATQQLQDDLHISLSRNNEYLISSNQNKEDQGENNTSKEERSATGETTDTDIRYTTSSMLQDTETVKEMRSKVEHSCPEKRLIKRDSQTERLLVQWRGKNEEGEEEQRDQLSPVPSNPYAHVCSEVNLEQILDNIHPEKNEAVHVPLRSGWTMFEESKRHSQAPHLKWAKNVVRNILGHSEEETIDEDIEQTKAVIRSDTCEEEVTQGAKEIPFITLSSIDQHSEPELGEDDPLEDLRDDEDDWSKSWGGAEIRSAFNTFVRRKRNSKFFKRAQLYQQYNEAAQNLEILSQSGSAAHPLPEDSTQSSAPSPPPARRPLPPLPHILHPHSLFHTSSTASTKSLPLPEPPRSEGRPSSPRLSTSFTQSPTLWRDLPGVRNNAELEELTEDQRRLQEVQFEVVTSEASYCRSLDIVVEHFVKSKQLGALLTSQDRNWLFSRLADVRAISHSFLSKLEERVESDMMHFTVCDIIVQHCPRFRKVYVPYLTNQSYQDGTYQRLMNENPGFKRIVEKLERNPVCERLPFRSFLVLPFQRITRIKLLVQNIVKRTTPGTLEATHAIKAMKLLEKLIQESNDSISQMKNIEDLVSLNAKVDFECKTLPLVSQSRRLIREGPVTELMDFSLKDTERNAYLHLFNDFLLVSLQKEGGRFTVVDHSPVSELRVENCRVKLHTLQKNLFRLHMAHKSLLLRSDTQTDKLRWISALSRPHPEVDFSAAQDVPQMQCIRAFVAQQPDELSLDKADIILVHQKSSDHWVEGTRLPDCHRGWVPESNLETIGNPIVRQSNLLDALKLTTATAAV